MNNISEVSMHIGDELLCSALKVGDGISGKENEWSDEQIAYIKGMIFAINNSGSPDIGEYLSVISGVSI